MRFRTEAGGISRTVEVRPTAAGWVATVDGRQMRLDVAAVGGRWSVLIGSAADELSGPAVPARSYDVVIDPRSPGDLVVLVDGQAVAVRVSDAGAVPGRRSRDASPVELSGPYPVRASMPGRVVKVLVTVGDTVTARQGLAVVEAMKMQNELRAPRAGRVRDVHATEGMPVDAGTVLIVLE